MRTLWLLFVTLLFSVSSCGELSVNSVANSSGSAAPRELSYAKVSEAEPGGGGGGRNQDQTVVPMEVGETSQQPAVPTDRKIIRNADIALESDSPEESQIKITAIAESKGGFLVESQQSSSDGSTTRDIIQLTLRVPSDKFTETLDEIRKTAKRVVVETVKGQDVTEQFIDIEAQLRAKKALELQFMEIMKRANTVAEALEVQRQLAEVRGEIEKVEGRKRFLENQSALSTIKVNLRSPAAISASSAGFGYRLTDSFSSGIEIALNFILGLITFLIGVLPFVLFIGLPVFLVGRHYWRRNRRTKTANQIAKEEIAAE